MNLRVQDALNQVADNGTRFAFTQLFGWLKTVFDGHGHATGQSGVLPFYKADGSYAPISLAAGSDSVAGGSPVDRGTGDPAEFPEA